MYRKTICHPYLMFFIIMFTYYSVNENVCNLILRLDVKAPENPVCIDNLLCASPLLYYHFSLSKSQISNVGGTAVTWPCLHILFAWPSAAWIQLLPQILTSTVICLYLGGMQAAKPRFQSIIDLNHTLSVHRMSLISISDKRGWMLL